VKQARRTFLKTVFDKQNPRKKMMFFDLVQTYRAGLMGGPEEEDERRNKKPAEIDFDDEDDEDEEDDE